MGTVIQPAEEVERGLAGALLGPRKTVVGKSALAVGAMIERQTPNTVERANLLPLESERQDRREQWPRLLLKTPLLASTGVVEPFVLAALAQAVRNGQTVLRAMDQTDLCNRMALRGVAPRVGDQVPPLAWLAEAGPAHIGSEVQKNPLEPVRAWLPPEAKGVLSADRFDPSAALFAWGQAGGWGYRLRLKGTVLADTGHGDETTTGALAQGVAAHDFPEVRRFAQRVMTNLALLHEVGHPEPWIFAMDCPPSRAAVPDYAACRAIEPRFSDFKERGFDADGSQLWHAGRLEWWVLVMALAMYWCVRVGQGDAMNRPTLLEKNARPKRPGAWEFQETPTQLGDCLLGGCAA